MRAVVCAFVFFWGCGGAGPVVVTVAPLPSARPAPIARTEDCRIEGTGERSRDEDGAEPFEIFSSRRAREVAFVIATPSEAHVAWSQFPAASFDGRARAELGGQKHIRYAGFAALHGRTFSLKKRFSAEPGHMWARAGAPVEMVAFEDGWALARVDSPFVAPKTFVVRGACDAVAYDPSEPDVHASDAHDAQETTLGQAYPASDTLHFYAEASGDAFMTVTPNQNAPLYLDVIGRSAGFVRVHAEPGDLVIDAWVPARDVDETSTLSVSGYGSMSGSSSCGGGGSSEHGVVARDAALSIGAKPTPLEGAVVEQGADVDFDTSSAVSLRGRLYVPFVFTDEMIAAGEDSHLWIDRDAIH